MIALREGKGLSQEQLAEELKVTRQTISNWENDKVKIDVSKGAEICAYYGISMDELFGEYVPARRRRLVENRTLPAVLLFVLAAVLGVFGGLMLALGGDGTSSAFVVSTGGGAIAIVVVAALAALAAFFMLIKRK